MSEPTVTALVVFRSASGRRVHGGEAITTETLAEALPDPAEVADASAAFHDLGFDVGPPLGISMSITASHEHLESVFGVELAQRADGTWVLGGADDAARSGDASDDATDDIELPLAALPERITRVVAAVVIEPPVELFGELTP